MRHASSGRHPMTGSLITTATLAATHPRCGAAVLEGWAEGLFARVDLTPLNRTGEIHAICAGVETYTLTRIGLVHRDAHRIAGGSVAGPVLAEHRCHRLIPADQRAIAPPAPTVVAVDEPPY